MSEIYFVVTLSNSKMSFMKKNKRALSYGEYRFTKLGQLTKETLGKVQKLFWSYSFLFDGRF